MSPNKPGWGVWAYLCPDCEHYASQHLNHGTDLVADPYRCTECGCEQHRDTPWLSLTRAEYELREANRRRTT